MYYTCVSESFVGFYFLTFPKKDDFKVFFPPGAKGSRLDAGALEPPGAQVFNQFMIFDKNKNLRLNLYTLAQDAGASPPGPAAALQWQQV